MKIATTPEFLQSVLAHPEVWRWIAPDGADPNALQLEALFEQGIGIEFETGGFFFHRLGDGVFEVHTLFLPGSENVFQACLAAAHFMFCGTECQRIVTKVPADNVPAWKLTEKMQFRPTHVRERAFQRDGELHDVKHYSLDFDDWMRRQESPRWVAQQCTELGQQQKAIRALYRWAVVNDDYDILGGG